MHKAPQVPIEYFATASQSTLESLELARLNHIAYLRAEIHPALEEWLAAEVDAHLAHRLAPPAHTLFALPPHVSRRKVAHVTLRFRPTERVRPTIRYAASHSPSFHPLAPRALTRAVLSLS
jgi:hypothetical protein